ncbi:TetR/AcrR family transcriptional regulator [Chromobacterium paludis]|nr:TetR/AcrR family transcriptional regulator [Chromobacterium paludis]
MHNTPDAKPINHRTLVGQQRRERTRQKILQAALRVFARKGAEAPLIDDFIAEAQIARGTFYNYFRTTTELTKATVEWLSADFIESIEIELGDQQDPLQRLSTGLQLWLHKAAHDPAWAAFVARPEFIQDLPLDPVRRDLRAGKQSGLFRFPSERVALDLLTGTLILAMRGHASGDAPPDYVKDIAGIVLQGLGVEPASIAAALTRPLPAMRRPPVSLPGG